MRHVQRIVTYFCKSGWVLVLSFLWIAHAEAGSITIKINQTELALPYWHANAAHYGAVILVSGGEHSQWSLLLARFAKQLAHSGWSVVLLNCSNTNGIPWVDQLPKLISTLRQENNKRIVLIHYGDQLNQSLNYFVKPQSKMINGLVMISAYDSEPDSVPTKLRFPLLDITGQFDYETVLIQRASRAKELKQSHYVALEMPGANHDYEYSQNLLLAFTHGWMSKLPEIEIASQPILVSYIEPIVFLPKINRLPQAPPLS